MPQTKRRKCNDYDVITQQSHVTSNNMFTTGASSSETELDGYKSDTSFSLSLPNSEAQTADTEEKSRTNHTFNNYSNFSNFSGYNYNDQYGNTGISWFPPISFDNTDSETSTTNLQNLEHVSYKKNPNHNNKSSNNNNNNNCSKLELMKDHLVAAFTDTSTNERLLSDQQQQQQQQQQPQDKESDESDESQVATTEISTSSPLSCRM